LIDQGDVSYYSGSIVTKNTSLPLRNLTMRIVGDNIYIADGISLFNYSIENLKQPKETLPMELEQISHCNDIYGGFITFAGKPFYKNMKEPLLFRMQGL
jgi:hypothetical protein